MLTIFAKGSIIYVWQAPECVSECDSIKSYKKVAGKATLKTWKFSQRKIPQILGKQNKDMTNFFGSPFKNYF